MDVAINYKGKLYLIDKEPFETFEETYCRGWFIIKNMHNYPNYNQVVSLSIMNNNLKKGMKYDIINV